MNAKLKSILTSAWNEPRAFFGWLTLFSALLFGCAALFVQGTAAARTYLNPVPPAVQMTALFALLIGAAAFGCFVLAWIPPLRRVFAWLLKRRFFVIAFLATLIALFYALENWRGRRAWANFQNEWAAKGEYFEIAKVVPPPVPDEENFFTTKPWENLRQSSTNRTGVWNNAPAILTTSLKGRPSRFGNIAHRTRTDLAAWQEYYRGTNNLVATGDGSFTNYFPVSPNPQTPAKDVLLALSRHNETLHQLHDAARRPHSRFWINYEDGFNAPLQHLSKLKGCVQYLYLHAIASLADGDTDTALKDILLSYRLGATLKSEPTLISHLVQIAISQITAGVIWESSIDRRWTDAQLVSLGEALAHENHLENYRLGMRGERAFVNHYCDQFNRTRDLYSTWTAEESVANAESIIEQTVGNSLFRLLPGGWFTQNKVSNSRMHMEFIQPAVDVERMMVSPSTTKRMDEECIKRPRLTPYNMFSSMLLPALGKAAQRVANAQSVNDRARIAIALERHYLAHKQYPETLDALVPQFITKIPHDVINGQPLKYRRTETGGFILYSVGWNEKDDGGTVVMTSSKTPSVDMTKGDWVWASEAK